MQFEEGQEKRKQWKAEGEPPCRHISIEKEYYLGGSTGDYVCTSCGLSMLRSDFEKLEKEGK